MYTTPIRWIGYQRNKIGGALRHLVRDVDRQNGEEVNHSNQNIFPELTDMNTSYVPDGNGGFRQIADRREVLDFIDLKIDGARNFRVKRDPDTKEPLRDEAGEVIKKYVKIRKDANVVVEVVLALDPNFYDLPPYEERSDEKGRPLPTTLFLDDDQMAKTVKYLHAMRNSFIDYVGRDKIAYIAEHWDETNPQFHIGFVPITEDGQLSEKQFFDGHKGRGAAQAAYRKVHDCIRNDLRAAGYEATMERVSEGSKGVSVNAYKKRMQNERELDEKQKVLQRRESDLIADQRKLGSAITKFNVQSKDIVAKRKAKAEKLTKREKFLDQKAEQIEAEKIRAYDDAKAEAKQQLLSIGELTPGRLKVDALGSEFLAISKQLKESNPAWAKLFSGVAFVLSCNNGLAEMLAKSWPKIVASQPTRTAKQIDAIRPPQVQKADDYDIEL
ncbi:plasmid recombination protein [Propionimicrobium lymphophilum]|uniref:plasmid recombination protein n=1 Tax=Propionimicrobium lymphophilum TaxID=33012 RepID=UPI00041E9E57|nr:plasmid recombination protein [Propionimicrobium lymphophilum]